MELKALTLLLVILSMVTLNIALLRSSGHIKRLAVHISNEKK